MTITSIKQQQHKPNRYSVYIDGEYVFSMDGTDILYYKLKEGSEIDEDRLQYLTDTVIFQKAKDKALRYLAYAPRTEKEITDKLDTEGYDDITANKVVEALKDYGYIDDYKYTEAYIRDRSNISGYGFLKIKDELKRKGIAGRVIDEIWKEEGPDETASAIRMLDKKLRGGEIEDDTEKRKLSDYLQRRGFTYETVKEAIREYMKK